MTLSVEWYSGYTRYDQPRRFLWQGQWLEVLAVLAREYLPDGACLKVLASDRKSYRLTYTLEQDAWVVAALGQAADPLNRNQAAPQNSSLIKFLQTLSLHFSMLCDKLHCD